MVEWHSKVEEDSASKDPEVIPLYNLDRMVMETIPGSKDFSTIQDHSQIN